MKCSTPGINEKLVQFVENLLPPGEMEEVSSHLRTCDTCREEEESLRETAGLLKAASSRATSAGSPCPDESLLVSFAEAPDSLKEGDRRMVARHVKKCPDCRETLSLLSELDRELEKAAQSAPLSVSMPEALKKEARRLYGTEKESLWQKCLQFFQIRSRYSLLSALAVTLLVVGVFSILFNDMAGTRQGAATRPAVNENQGFSGSMTTKADNLAKTQPGAPENKKGLASREETMSKDQLAQAPAGITTNAGYKREKESTAGGALTPVIDEKACRQAENSAYKPAAACGAQAPSTSTQPLNRAGEAPAFSTSSDDRNRELAKCKMETQSQTEEGRGKIVAHPGKRDSLSGSSGMTDKEQMAMLHSRTSVNVPARFVDEKKQREEQMKKQGETVINGLLGSGRAAIDVTVVPDGTSSAFAVKRVVVLIRCTTPLGDDEREKMKDVVMAALKLDAKRDSLVITGKAAQ